MKCCKILFRFLHNFTTFQNFHVCKKKISENFLHFTTFLKITSHIFFWSLRNRKKIEKKNVWHISNFQKIISPLGMNSMNIFFLKKIPTDRRKKIFFHDKRFSSTLDQLIREIYPDITKTLSHKVKFWLWTNSNFSKNLLRILTQSLQEKNYPNSPKTFRINLFIIYLLVSI